MKLSTKLAAFAATTGLAVASLAGPAHAALTGDTATTFTITGGALAITVPPTATLGSVSAGAATVAAQLGSVTVADTRGALLNSWTTTVSSTTFARATGTATANETVAVGSIAYSAGASTASSGLGAFVPGTLPNGTVPGIAGTHTAFAGNSSTTWDPTLTLTLLSSQVAGTYNGTVTHSVA
ncbi:MAG: hypothetical protein QOE93_826 [Actinomycetota bacterium]|nr:hypothetical protein [Actinomycetota bacterium]